METPEVKLSEVVEKAKPIKVTYLGDKKDMVCYGHNFSNGKAAKVWPHENYLTKDGHTINILKKFIGNTHFKCECEGDVEPPTHYVRQIKILSVKQTGEIGPTGPVKAYIKVRENINIAACYSAEEAEHWIETHDGTLGETHYIIKA